MEQVSGTQLNIIDLLITLAGFASVGAALYFFYPHFLKGLKDKLSKSLNRMTANSETRPLYDVFVGFNHPNTAAWVSWVKNEEEEIQQKAFSRLKTYLEEEPYELGLVTAEVVEAIALFENEESFQVLEKLIDNTKGSFERYKSIESFFNKACNGLISLDPVESKVLLQDKIDSLKEGNNTEACKQIITAISESFEAEDSFEKAVDTFLDEGHRFETRKFYLDKLFELEDIRQDLLLTTFQKQAAKYSEQQPNEDDQAMLAITINLLLGLDDSEGQIWKMIIDAVQNVNISKIIASALQDIIPDPKCQLDTEQCLALLSVEEPEANAIIERALVKRFKITNKERDSFSAKYLCPEMDLSQEISYFEKLDGITAIDSKYLHKDLASLKDKLFAASNTAGIKLLLGNNKKDKLDHVRHFVALNKSHFVYMDASAIFSSPDKLTEIMDEISGIRPCLIYLDKFTGTIESIQNNEVNIRTRKIIENFIRLSEEDSVTIVGALDDSKKMLKESPIISAFLESMPNEYAAQTLELNYPSEQIKEKIISNLGEQIGAEREFSKLDIEKIFSDTGDQCSTIEFYQYLGKFFKEELLSKGTFGAAETSSD